MSVYCPRHASARCPDCRARAVYWYRCYVVLGLAAFAGAVHLWTRILPNIGAWIWIPVLLTWLSCVAGAHWLIERVARREGVDRGR